MCLHSNFLRGILESHTNFEMVIMFVPISSNILTNLLKILSHGRTNNDTKFNPMDLIAGAELLGILLEDLQVGINKDETCDFLNIEKTSAHLEITDLKNETDNEEVVINKHSNMEFKSENGSEDGLEFDSSVKDPIESEKRMQKGNKKELKQDNSPQYVWRRVFRQILKLP